MKTTGFAVAYNGRIMVETVSPTERAAKVNWLVTEYGERITIFTKDEEIDRLWQVAGRENADLIEVTIAPLQAS